LLSAHVTRVTDWQAEELAATTDVKLGADQGSYTYGNLDRGIALGYALSYEVGGFCQNTSLFSRHTRPMNRLYDV